MAYLGPKTSNLNLNTNYISNGKGYYNNTGWSTYRETDSVTFQDAGDTVTLNNHGLSNNAQIAFTSITSTTGISINTVYFVVNATTNTFQVASSSGGSALSLTTDGSGTLVRSIPKTGSGGINLNLLFAVTAGSNLRQGSYFTLNKTSSTNVEGSGAAFDFTIDNADLAKVLTISFDYQVFSGTYSTGDVTVYLIQNPTTTPVIIQPAGFQIQAGSVGTKMKHIATFQTASNATSYRLCFHVSTPSTSNYQLQFDNISVGPQTVQYGAPVTDWVDYTPTGTWTTNTAYTGKWRRVGDSMEVSGRVTLLGFPTPVVSLTVNLPSGFSIDTNKLTTTTPLGSLSWFDVVNSASQIGFVVYSSTTAVLLAGQRLSSASNHDITPIRATVPKNFTTGDQIDFTFSVPILGWSSTVQMSNDTDTRVVAAKYSGNSNVYNAGQTLQYNTKEFDTHSAVTTGAFWNFFVPVSGYYSVFLSGTRSSSGTQTHGLYKNNTTFVQNILTNIDASGKYDSGGTTIFLNAGETISIKTDNAATIEVGYISIERLSGPSAIAATETCAEVWQGIGAQTFANNTITTLKYQTKLRSTHGSYDSSTGIFTAPVSGFYSASMLYGIQAPAAGTTSPYTVDAIITTSYLGSQMVDRSVRVVSNNQIESVKTSGLFYLVAGSTLTFQARVTFSGTAPFLVSASLLLHNLSIVRVGN